MNRRMGIESTLGIGGGIVSAESTKNLEKAEELIRKGNLNDAVPFVFQAMKDPNNVDALITAAFLSQDLKSTITMLATGELRARNVVKKCLGDDVFEDSSRYAGKFWSLLETRPYMRLLQAQVKVFFDNGDYEKSANTIIEMLRLCPGDNMGQRYWLGSLLCQLGRYSDALFFAQSHLAPNIENDVLPPRGGTIFKPPRREIMTAKGEGRVKYRGISLLYTAALASFKLWGDCPESAQYLRIAAKASPYVLVKVLARKTKPANLNNDGRSLDGPEDAHDYLWLTQELWMTDDVWNWVDANQDVKKFVLKVCSRGECTVVEGRPAQFQRCSSCRQVAYCGKECQKQDWKTHKPSCLRHRQDKEMMRSMMTGAPIPRKVAETWT